MKLRKIILPIFIFVVLFSVIVSYHILKTGDTPTVSPIKYQLSTTSYTKTNFTRFIDYIYPSTTGDLYYAGSNSYDNVTNLWYIGDNAYVVMQEEWGSHRSDWESHFHGVTYKNITKIYISIYARDYNAYNDLNLYIYNFNTSSWEALFVNYYFPHSSYGWKNVSKDINEDYLENGYRVRLRFTASQWRGWYGRWFVDYFEVKLEGYIDTVPPIISSIDISPSGTIYTNDTITINSTVYDEDSSIKYVLYNFSGSVGLDTNVTFMQNVTTHYGDVYQYKVKLAAGNWTLKVIASDIYGNIITNTTYFDVYNVSGPYIEPQVFFTVNTTTPEIGQVIQFTIHVRNGTDNLDRVWVYDGIKNQNITLEDNINLTTNKKYLYNTSSTVHGTYDFIFYVNDSAGTTISFEWLNTLKVVVPEVYPDIFNIVVNDSRLGINHYTQLNFSVKASDWNLDDVWIFDPTINETVFLDRDVNDTSIHTYSYIVTTNLSGSYRFIIYANNTKYSYSHTKSETTIITWYIIRDRNLPEFTYLYINDSYLYVNRKSLIVWNVSSGEYDLKETWIYDPILDQNITVGTIMAKGEFQFNYTATSGTEGEYIFIIFCSDIYNNTVNITLKIEWAKEIVLPLINIYVNKHEIQISETLILKIDIVPVKMPVKDLTIIIGEDSYIIFNNKNETKNLSYYFEIISNTERTLNITVICTDTDGNTATESVSVRFVYIPSISEMLWFSIYLTIVMVLVGFISGGIVYYIKKSYLKSILPYEITFVYGVKPSKEFLSTSAKLRMLYYIYGIIVFLISIFVLMTIVASIFRPFIPAILTDIDFALVYSVPLMMSIFVYDDWKWVFGLLISVSAIFIVYNLYLTLGIIVGIVVIVIAIFVLKYIGERKVSKPIYGIVIK